MRRFTTPHCFEQVCWFALAIACSDTGAAPSAPGAGGAGRSAHDAGSDGPLPVKTGATGSGGTGAAAGGSSGSGGGVVGGAGRSGGGRVGAGGAFEAGASGGLAGANARDGATSAGLHGPLRVSSNPRYFEDATGQALVLMGSHTWNDLQDWGADGAVQPLDFTAYVRFLAGHGHNFTLLWRTELPKFCGLPTTDSNPPSFTTSPEPWPRTGPGMANDGAPKFDLSKFDPAYFDRLRSRVSELNDSGIWVGVYLFTGEWLNVYRCSDDGHPLTGPNNVNGIDDGGGNGSMNMTAPNALTRIEDAMVDATVDALNDLPNVLWIVSEEAAASTEWWQGHMIAHVRAYESTKPLQHPVGLAAVTGAPDSVIYDSDADWVAPFAMISPSSTCGAGTPKCKVNLNDSDHSYFGMWNDSAQKNRQYAWENFLRGNQVAFMDPYTVYYPRQDRNHCVSPAHGICTAPDPRWNGFRDNLGYILEYSRKLNLKAAEPNQSLCSTTYCLGETPPNKGTEILVYAPNGGSFTVNLSSAPGRTMAYEWFDPASGAVVSKGTVQGGSNAQSFATPAAIAGDGVLYVVDAAGHG